MEFWKSEPEFQIQKMTIRKILKVVPTEEIYRNLVRTRILLPMGGHSNRKKIRIPNQDKGEDQNIR
jgi:hypothetical protein